MEKPLSSFPFGSGPDRNASLNSSRWAPFERFPDFGPDRHSPGPCPQSTLLEQAHWGDILLFRCMTLPAAVFRAVSLCNWDHVGVVVTNKDGKLLLLEAGVDGTVVCPLERRLTEYRELFADQISWRRLRRTQPVADEPTVVAAMHQFVAEVEGLRATTPFELPRMVLAHGSHRWLDGHSPGQPLAPSPPHPEAYWCSEIIVELYRRCGLVPSGAVAASCWPADLADGGKLQAWLELAGCVWLEPERRVIFETDAAAGKHEAWDSGASGTCWRTRKNV